jgi:Tetrapyrrole (Corrin/Porphyrin) Methylases
VTIETEHALRESAVIYHLLSLTPAMRRYLSRLGPRLVNLAPLYRDGALDLDIYEFISSFVVASALRHRRLALIVPGHPLVYATPTALIQNQARMRGIKVLVLPAISSIDTMLLQLGLDIADHGVQIYESNRFVYYGNAPDPRVPLFLMQPGGFGTGIITRGRTSVPRRFRNLSRALLATYPPRHRCCLVTSSIAKEHPGALRWFALRDLERMAPHIDYHATLYIPPSQPSRERRPAFVSKLADHRHAMRLIK